MKRLIILCLACLACLALSGCAAYKCNQAQFGFIISGAMLQTPKTGAESDFWMRYKQGTKQAIEDYCLNQGE